MWSKCCGLRCFNRLTHKILALPKGTAEVHFLFSPAHSPQYPLTHFDPSCQLLNTNWRTCCIFLSILAQMCSRRTMFVKRTIVREEWTSMEKLRQPLKIQPDPFFSESFFSCFFFFLRKTVLITKSTEKCLARTTALARTIASCENDLWLRCARERCNIASQGGDWLWSYHIYVLPNMSSNTAHENDEWLDMRFPTA